MTGTKSGSRGDEESSVDLHIDGFEVRFVDRLGGIEMVLLQDMQRQ